MTLRSVLGSPSVRPAREDTDAPRGLRRHLTATPTLLAPSLLLLLVLLPRPTLLATEGAFRRGDANGDGAINLADVIRVLDTIFLGSAPPACADAADPNDDGAIDLQDPVALLAHLLSGGTPPLAPFPACGTDPSVDALPCSDAFGDCPADLPPLATFGAATELFEDTTGISFIAHPGSAGPGGFPAARPALRPFLVDLADSRSLGPVRIECPDPAVELFLPTGVPLPVPVVVPASLLPLELFVGVTAPTDALLTVTDVSTGAGDTIRLVGHARAELVGTVVATEPSFRPTRTFLASSAEVSVRLDPARFADRLGSIADVCVVPHRTDAAWVTDPTLVDASGGAETVTLNGDAVVVWNGPLDPGPRLARSYDVVLDLDGDGLLGPGDILDGGDAGAAFHVVAPLDLPGPHPVSTANHSGGVLLAQRTYYPTDIATLGAQPLVVISHGSGHLYTWYDYLGEHLASYGYVVTSHQNDTLPGVEAAASTTLANTDSFIERLDTIAGGALLGHVDLDRIAWIGHSRGGEGALRALHRVVEGISVPAHFTAEQVRAVAAIAPTVFLPPQSASPHDRPFHLIAGGADGDVTGGVDCAICQFFRYSRRGTGPVSVSYVHGASHNDFNCCGILDGLGPAQITADTAQRIARGSILAFLEVHLQDDPATADFLALPAEDLPENPSLVGFPVRRQSVPALSADALRIDDFQEEPSSVSASSEGWTVTSDVDFFYEVDLVDGDQWLAPDPTDIPNGMTQTDPGPGADRGLVLGWALGGGGDHTWSVPVAERDWRPFATLTLRAAQISRHAATVLIDGPVGFSIELEDADGVVVTLPSADFATVPPPYPRIGLGPGEGWSDEFVTLRVPLSAFAGGTALDLSRIGALRLRFGDAFGSSTGRIAIDDLQLVP